jgi:drug/metabolite transporter (DMT)-like permease
VGRRHLLMLLALAAIWGSSFLFIKVAVRELSPSALVFGRLLLGAVVLAAVLATQMPIAEAVAWIRPKLWPLAVVGLLNTALPFWFLAWGETRIDSGFAAVLQAAAPLFTALIAFGFFHSERVSGSRLAGFVIGIGGVALLVGATPKGSVLASVAVVGAAASYALSALYAGRHLVGLPPLVIAFGATALAMLMSAPAGLAQLPSAMPGWKTIGSVAVLGVVGLGVAYALYFGIIVGAGASRAILVTYLVPPMALFYGTAILGEPVRASALGGLALIFGGVVLGAGVFARRTAAGIPA